MWFIGFVALILFLLVFDFNSMNREDHVIEMKEALKQTGFWIAVSVVFGLFVFWTRGLDAGSQWFTAYIIEKSLSVDNLFVFLAIFTYFKVAGEYQHKILYYGIAGAIALRAICICGGVALLHWFHPLIYFFGGILLYTAWKVGFTDSDSEEEFDRTAWARWLTKTFRFDFEEKPYSRGRFITHILKDNKVITYGTKLLFVLLIVEATDLLFATDSIPAALACSPDSFIVFTSNIFAVLGLRSLFFALSALMGRFQFLKYGVSLVLALIGIKMIGSNFIDLPMSVWLMAVAGILGTSVAVSIAVPETEN